MTKATTADVVRANDQVHEHLERQAHAHERRERHVTLEPSEAGGADQAAQGGRRRQRAEADRAHVQMLRRVEHQDAPGRRPRHVEDQDDDDERADGGVAAQPPQTLPDRVRLGAGGHGVLRRDRRSRDPRDQEHGETHAQDLHEERPERPDREEERAQRRTDELVAHEEPGLQSRVAEPEVGGPHQHRQKGAARRVGEHLGRAVEEGRREHDPHRDMTGDEEDHQAPDDHRAQAVRQHDEPPPVVMVGDGPGQQAEQQPRQELHHRAAGHQQRRRGQRGDQQRRGRQGDAVADVARPRRRQQPAEVGAESAWSDQFAETRALRGPRGARPPRWSGGVTPNGVTARSGEGGEEHDTGVGRARCAVVTRPPDHRRIGGRTPPDERGRRRCAPSAGRRPREPRGRRRDPGGCGRD